MSKLTADEIIAKYNEQHEKQREYHAERNAKITKLVAFYKKFAGNCKELDEFMAN